MAWTFCPFNFFFGGIAAITSSKAVNPPFSYLWVIFGAISLFGLFSAIFLGNPFTQFCELEA